MHEQPQDTPVSNVPAVPGREKRNELQDAWREVGSQFQQLGTRLAAAFKQSWESSESQASSRESLRNLRDDLREAANRVEHVIQEVGEDTREERRSTFRATRRASEQSLEEARLLTAATLRKLNRQLEHLVTRFEQNNHRSDSHER